MVKKFSEVCESLEWSVHEYDGDRDVELEKYSPAGEDFVFTVEKDGFVENVAEYARTFDVDEHVELWIKGRGEGGVPATTRELVEDAEAIKEMLGELAAALEKAAEEVTATDVEQANREELFRLMQEYPELTVVPMVETEVVAGGDFGYWLASFGSVRVREFAIDEYYGDGVVRFRDEYGAEDTIVEGIAESKYEGTDEGYERAKKEAAALWTKAIVVYINTRG